MNSLSIKNFYHETALVQRPSGTNEMIYNHWQKFKGYGPKIYFPIYTTLLSFNQQNFQIWQLLMLLYYVSHIIIPTINLGLIKWSQKLLPDYIVKFRMQHFITESKSRIFSNLVKNLKITVKWTTYRIKIFLHFNVIKIVSDCGILWVLRFLPPMKLTATIIAEILLKAAISTLTLTTTPLHVLL